MPRFTKTQKILMGLIVFFLIVGGLARYSSISFFNGLSDGALSVKYSLIDQPMHTLTKWYKDFGELWNVHEENDRLRSELADAEIYNGKYEDVIRENNEYKKILDLDSEATKYEKIYASVYRRDSATWNDTLVLSKGSADGVIKDMIVINTEGVVGRVENVNEHTSTVRLLTSTDVSSKLSVKISIDDETEVDGILDSYDVENNRYIIRLYQDNEKIEKGQKVLSSGKGGVYPSGFVVGTVDTADKLTTSNGKQVTVVPVDDFSNFNTLIILGSQVSE